MYVWLLAVYVCVSCVWMILILCLWICKYWRISAVARGALPLSIFMVNFSCFPYSSTAASSLSPSPYLILSVSPSGMSQSISCITFLLFTHMYVYRTYEWSIHRDYKSLLAISLSFDRQTRFRPADCINYIGIYSVDLLLNNGTPANNGASRANA